MMRNSTLRLLSKVMCLVLVASFVLEAPLFAAFEGIKVNVGGQQINVTPGQWVSVRQGTHTVNYNVRYVNGQPVAMEMSQYYKMVFGNDGAAAAAATAATSGSPSAQTAAPAKADAAAAPVAAPASAETTSAQGAASTNAQADAALAPTTSGATTVDAAPAAKPTLSSKISGFFKKVFNKKGADAKGSGDSAQSGQSGQASGEAAPNTGLGSKIKAGFGKVKTMAGAGVQNVKSSLKSGFSPKNLLVTAGITVGVDLANQIISGEKPSLKKAVKVVASAEFVGGVAGSVVGAAAGSFFVPFLSAVPVVGGFLSALAPTFGSVAGGAFGSYLAGDLKNGRFSLAQAFKQINWGNVAGQAIGSTLGTMLGSAIFPPFGSIIGGMVGGFLGGKVAGMIGKLFGHKADSTIALPVGSNPIGDTAVTGSVTIGNAAGGAEIPVSGDQAQVAISGDAEAVGSYASEVQIAYAKYQELYRVYNEMVAQGREAEAARVASEMNAAKASYDALRANSAK